MGLRARELPGGGAELNSYEIVNGHGKVLYICDTR